MIFTGNKELNKNRKEASELLQTARKIYAYRQDLLPEKDREDLKGLIGRLNHHVKDKSTSVEFLHQIKKEADAIMRRTGGSFYPKNFLAENSEMLIFAAILAIGIRSFFLQPFKIPTNSMYPTYNGMTAKVYAGEKAPNPAVEVFRFLTLGARNYDIEAPAPGELAFATDRQLVDGRKWLVIPTKKFRYTFYIDNSPVEVDLPLEFDIRQVLDPIMQASGGGEYGITRDGTRVLKTGIQVDRGETAFSFDLLTGDQLFVDRMSYHFIPPDVGDPIVFRTDNLENIDRNNRGKYYIKRAVARPGDELVIDPPDLMLNGEPISGSKAFERNRNQEAPYTGYVFPGRSQNYPLPFADGSKPVQVPEDHYFAMGDNSPNSADSRMWGFVPQTEMVGRAVFIYYPFSHRWGLAE